MNLKKRMVALSLAATMVFGTIASAMADNAVKDELVSQMSGAIKHAISFSYGDDFQVYTNLEEIKVPEKLPSRFDLRDQGIVPPVRSQGSLGTCWTFASMGASEISILNSLNMTYEEFKAANGVEMDLSEKHLAWFSTVPLPEADGQDQAGEGRFLLDPNASTTDHYWTGGFMGYASGMFASGMGPTYEILVPYTDSEGTDSLVGDWSLEENQRFASLFDLKDSSILPCPAVRGADEHYAYNPAATEIIKNELLNGRAVSIMYAADQAMDPDVALKMRVDQFVAQGYDRRISELLWKSQLGYPQPEDATDEELNEVRRLMISLMMKVPLEAVTDDIIAAVIAQSDAQEAAAAAAAAEMTEEDIAAAEAAQAEAAAQAQAEAEAKIKYIIERLDSDPEFILAVLQILNNTSKPQFVNWDTVAQYTYDESVLHNHSVLIVGYDDDYAVSNFRPENPPPAPGAWIVRNSWGKEWGNEGYFYLSYYDKSIIAPESFEYVTDVDALTASKLFIHQYDYMPATTIHSARTKEPVYLANEFTVNVDSVLSYVSAMTANYDTNVTVAVYLLNDDAQSPTDGKLLDVCTVDYEFAGYHRIALNQHFLLPAGARISVVQTQRIHAGEDLYYALPYTYACNSAFYDILNELPVPAKLFKSAVNGVINHGESFVNMDGKWADWADFVNDVKDADTYVKEFTSFDNVSIKAYFYLLSDISEEHNFGEAVPYAGGSMKLCTECGYALVEQ